MRSAGNSNINTVLCAPFCVYSACKKLAITGLCVAVVASVALPVLGVKSTTVAATVAASLGVAAFGVIGTVVAGFGALAIIAIVAGVVIYALRNT